MQFRTCARRARGPLAILALLVALTTLPPAAAVAADGGHGPQASGNGWTATVVHRGSGYSRPDGSRRVRRIQRQLDHLGYGAGPMDGLFGPRTEAAVLAFQRRQGLVPDGVVGPRTQGRLRAMTAQANLLRRGSGYQRPDGSRRVRRIQRRLDKLGFRAGPVDGLFGPRTESAVRRFQRKHGLAPDGFVGPRTRRALHGAGRQQQTRHGGKRTTPRQARPERGPAGNDTTNLPVGFVLLGASLLGLLVFLASYVRTRSRLRAANGIAAPPPPAPPAPRATGRARRQDGAAASRERRERMHQDEEVKR